MRSHKGRRMCRCGERPAPLLRGPVFFDKTRGVSGTFKSPGFTAESPCMMLAVDDAAVPSRRRIREM